jgi:hypothetical protein
MSIEKSYRHDVSGANKNNACHKLEGAILQSHSNR